MRGNWKTNITFMHFIEYSVITQKQDHYIRFSNAEYSKNAITSKSANTLRREIILEQNTCKNVFKV
jgi:hypothetical protein